MVTIRYFILIVFNIIILSASAQIPPGILYKNQISNDAPLFFRDISNTKNQLIAEDIENGKNGNPLRVANGLPTQIDVLNGSKNALITKSGNKDIYQYNIEIKGSEGIILTFSSLYIPQNDTLFIYTDDGKKLQCIDYYNHKPGKDFATKIIYTNNLKLEYIREVDQLEVANIEIDNVAYLYRSKGELDCFINTTCSEGDNWQQQRDGVVGLLINRLNSWYVCTGSLVNNTNQDKTPFILTAHHCIDGYDEETFTTMQIDFFKESTSMDCFDASTTSSLTKSLQGASLIADIPVDSGSDGTLLKLVDSIPKDWKVFYNGWDARNIASYSGVSIHHPNGLIKKISTYNTLLDTQGNLPFSSITGDSSHWVVEWVETNNGLSVTYGGSSGSPLFNDEGLIIGTLTGGSSACNSAYRIDYYGKFSKHFNGYYDTIQWFLPFLDPNNTGVKYIKGYDPYGYSFNSNPVANEASKITPFGFTANWVKLNDTIDSYKITLYTKDEEGQFEYVNNYFKYDVGDTNSIKIEGLNSETDYYYTIVAIMDYSESNPSNEIKVRTSEITFEYVRPVATSASNITSHSFTANWEALSEANSYFINIYKHNEITTNCDTVNFDNNIILNGWNSDSKSFIETSNQFGEKAPSLRLNNDSYLISPIIDNDELNIKNIHFWYRGIFTDNISEIDIDYFKDDKWINYRSLNSLEIKKTGKNISIEIDSSLNVKQIRLSLNSSVGYLVIDDVILKSSNDAISTVVYSNLEATNSTNLDVTALESNSIYSFNVQGFNSSEYSLYSNEIMLKTLVQSDVKEKSRREYIAFSDDNIITVFSDEPINDNLYVYSIYGQLLLNKRFIGNQVQINRSHLNCGIYILRIGNDSQKILLK